jgi:molybdopterin synthase catalytic subunit
MTSKEQQGRNQDLITVGPDPVDPAALVTMVSSPSCGAVVLFLGTVRDHSTGKEGVTHLEYEAYDEVVDAKIAEIVAEAHGRWDLVKVVVAHRTGSLQVGEISVGVAVGSAHRAAAFGGGRYIIDELKARVPIWKKEHWPGGAEWVREDLQHQES